MNEAQAFDSAAGYHSTYATIRDILSSAGAVEPLRPDYCFIEDETLDSFTRINVLLELETAFAISLSASELMEEPNRSLAGLAALITTKSR